MALSLRDKISLIYTSAGSQRGVASLVGISHQKIGRILHEQSSPRVLSDPGLIAAVDLAFSIHKDMARTQARVHALPYDPRYPIFIQRMPLKETERRPTGELVFDDYTQKWEPKYKFFPVIDPKTGKQRIIPGDRVAALHTHWLSDRIRNAWIAAMQKTGKFAAASVGSIVNLIVYSKRADQEFKGKRRRPDQEDSRLQIKDKIINQQIINGLIYTKYTAMDAQFPSHYIIDDINRKLNEKHAPATGDPGTAFANQILLQVDTRAGKDGNSKDKQFRDAHPWKSKPRKARGNKGRARKR